MNTVETLRTGLEAIRAHRLRSGLTVLGILIGIAAVILTVGLGEGAEAQVTSEITALGTNLLSVSPGSSTSSSGIRGGFGTASTLTLGDARALQSTRVAPDVAGVAPIISVGETALTVGNSNWTTRVVGTTPSWLGVSSRGLASGRFLDNQDVADHTAVGVLGPTTAQELFGFRDPVGQTVNVDGVPVTVVGVLNSVGSSSSSSSTTTDPDDQILVPVSTAAERLEGSTTQNTVNQILVKATSAATLSAAYQEVDNELLALHGTNDVTVTPETAALSTAASVDRTQHILLAGIAAVSLLVGGIGVMNIMLVSVTERIREIGLRKALGATPAVIGRQFLTEASVLGLAGGLLGAGVGLGLVLLLPHFISNPVSISPVAAVGSIVLAMLIGVLAGVYPASRAARLAPIDALRSE